MKKVILVVLLILLIFLMSGCYSHYTGENTDLYTVAVNSLLWNWGYSSGADFLCDSEIEILEKDNYERILFSYTERNFNDEIAFSSLLICQKKENNYVYYYPDYNFISIAKAPYSTERVNFPKEKIEELKLLNDWNKEISLEKCIKKEIGNQKHKVEISKEILNEIFSKYDGYRGSCITLYLTSDDYGRFICYFRVFSEEEHNLVVLFNPDLTYDKETSIYEPTDFYNYQDEFKRFKELNNWNCELLQQKKRYL